MTQGTCHVSRGTAATNHQILYLKKHQRALDESAMNECSVLCEVIKVTRPLLGLEIRNCKREH